MNHRVLSVTSILTLGLALGPAAHTVLAQNSREVRSQGEEFSSPETEGFRVVTTRDDRGGRTVERSVVEGPSINGGTTVLSGAEDRERQIGTETSQRTRQEFVTDTNGRSRVVSTLEEQRTARPDGGEQIVRSFTEADVNGRARPTRQERKQTVAMADGVFSTQIEVSEPSINGGRFVGTERVEQRERRDGNQVLELDRTTYADPSGGGRWVAQERRVLTREYSDGNVNSVESVYTADDTGNLVQSDQIVSREWTGPGGREFKSEQVFSRDIPNEVRTAAPRLFQEVETVRTNRSSGGWSSTRTVSESRNGRVQVVERFVERARSDGRGGTVIELETQQLDVNGRLQTMSVSRVRESVR